jgi:hypothetical protein
LSFQVGGESKREGRLLKMVVSILCEANCDNSELGEYIVEL